MAYTDLGKAAAIPKGAWSGSATYEKLDIVSKDGSSYMAVQDVPAGTAVTNTSYWLKLAAKGDTGETGPVPVFSVGTVTTGEPGTDASATITGTADAPVLNMTIPRGDAGEVTENELEAGLKTRAAAIFDTASGDIVSFPDGADDVALKGLTVAIEPVQSGSGDPSPTNVRPISGWTGCNVTRAGKNLCQTYGVVSTYTNNGVTWTVNNDGTITVSGTPTGNSYPADCVVTFPKGAILTVSGLIGSYNIMWHKVRLVDENGTTLASFEDSFGFNNGTIDTSLYPTAKYLIINPKRYINGLECTGTIKLQVEIGSTASAYEPYHGTTIPISWQSSAGTVYGGTLDVTTGVLTVDRVMVASTWGNGDTTIDRGNNITSKKFALPNTAKNINATAAGDTTNVTSVQSYNTTGYVHFFIGDDNSAVVFLPQETSASQEIQILYELATSQTYQLDPITVQTLLGQNNIFADCGPSAVEYPCDTKLYIERLTAPEEDDMIANQNIASGVYFMVGNNLYLSTETITAGEAIVPGTGAGTNCTATSLAAALNALNT